MSFKNKTVFITGASAGIGLALARGFAKKEAQVVLTGRRRDRIDQEVKNLRASGYTALGLTCDVARAEDLAQAVISTQKAFQKIDVVIANAGFAVAGRLDQLTLEDYQRQFETNVWGVLRTIYATVEELKKTRGTLVLLGSVSGYVSLPGISAYGMSKFAIHALAQSLRAELKAFGVSVVLIAPGFVVSEIRQVDNRGLHHPQAKEPIPAWLSMPTEKAAEKIIRAIAARRKEEVITFHGKLIV